MNIIPGSQQNPVFVSTGGPRGPQGVPGPQGPAGVGGTKIYATLDDLQSALPGGSAEPVWIVAENSWYYWQGVITDDTTAPTVTASPAAGTYGSAQTVTLSANEAATIYFTMDGSTPTTSSSVYTTPINISSNTTLKYFAKDTAGNSSTIQTQTYTITILDTTAPTVTASPSAGTFTTVQTVTLSANETATIYYTTDGSTPTTGSNVYSAPIAVNATTTLKFFGKDTAGNSSAVQTAVYTINLADTTPPTVTESPAAGLYTGTQTVTLSTEAGATIYYTTDGSTPTVASTVYSSPITVSATTTIKFVGKDAAGNVSAPVTATYTITPAFTEGTYALQMNGTSDYLEFNDFQFDQLDITANLDAAGTGYLFDARAATGGVNNAFLVSGFAPSALFSDIKVDDVSVTKDASTVANFPRGVKKKYSLIFTSVLNGTSTAVIFARGPANYNQNFKGNIYSVKAYKAGVLQAHWDFTNQTVGTGITDQTGNNHPLTRNTGTWISG